MSAIIDPIFNGLAALLAACYAVSGNYALAIALFTLIIMLASTPLTLKSTRSMMAMQRVQPELKRLQTKYKGDRERLNQEMMALYQREGINPLGGCLPQLVQLPIFFILFRLLRGLTNLPDGAVTFEPKYLDHGTRLYKDLASGNQMVSFGIDLARQANNVVRQSVVEAIPYLILIAITGVTAWYQQKQMQARQSGSSTPTNSQQQMLMKVMPYTLPLFSFFMPLGMVIYFIISNLWRVGQQAYIHRSGPPESLVNDKGGKGPVIDVDEVGDGSRPTKSKPGPKAGKAGKGRAPTSGGAAPDNKDAGDSQDGSDNAGGGGANRPARPSRASTGPRRPRPPRRKSRPVNPGRPARGSGRSSRKESAGEDNTGRSRRGPKAGPSARGGKSGGRPAPTGRTGGDTPKKKRKRKKR